MARVNLPHNVHWNMYKIRYEQHLKTLKKTTHVSTNLNFYVVRLYSTTKLYGKHEIPARTILLFQISVLLGLKRL
jgi:hypothetical protein